MKSNNQTIGQSNNSRRGSALLVVLGMLAFMLFSGLAFSVYMRQSRLPTSFLRRTVSSRQLVKAALAEAIEEIDATIGNYPHPGVCSSSANSNNSSSDDDITDWLNIWSHRVFIREGMSSQDNASQSESSITCNGNTYYPAFAGTSETVPTLTLEGLAYLPPNLINEARYYSQRTPTAKWKSFWFDSGRYAYTAFDVSDYFDVNRVYANKPRLTGNRVSLAYLFEKIEQGEEEGEYAHTGAGSGADQWDSFMKQYRLSEDAELPLVSLADLNVAWGSQSFNFGGSAHGNPFYNFINNSGVPYPGGESDAAAYRDLNFVTDGWFPKPQSGKTENGDTIYDLADPTQQPFEMSDLKGNSRYNLTQVMSYADAGFGINDYPLNERMNMLNKAILWDYLDQNKVPISLAIPTCEQVPMICAIEPIVSGLNIKILQSGQPATASGAPVTLPSGETIQYYKKTVTYQLDLDSINAANIAGHYAIVYPFNLRGRKAQTVLNTSATDDGFTVDGRAAIFLSDMDQGNSISARPGEINGLHLNNHSSVSQGKIGNASIISLPIKSEDYDDPSQIYLTKNLTGSLNGKIPVKGGNIRLDMSIAQGAVNLVTVEYIWPYEVTIPATGGGNPTRINQNLKPGSTYQYSSGAESTVITPPTGSDFAILDSSGARVTTYSFLQNHNQSKKVKVNLALWLRVVNDDNKTVDLVPACLADDQNLNSVNNDGMANKLADRDSYPLIRLDVGSTFDFSFDTFEGNTPMHSNQPLELNNTQLYTGDPRYNHAVEDWEIVSHTTYSDADSLAEEWYTREIADASGKDGDIYMATSDMAEMQSVYELAFLPRLQVDGLTKQGMNDGFVGDYSTSYDGKIRGRDTTGDLMHRGFMWKTYSPFGRYGVNDFSEVGNGQLVSGDTGAKVNPFSDSKEVLMAAFADAPHDWRTASTNNPDTLKYWQSGKVENFNEEYAWNQYCEKAKGAICWDCLQDLADAFQAKVRASNGDWETAFRNLGWSYSSKELLAGNQLDEDDSELMSVDKKFLYGFWHDSFAARQQLFLIFVRAEPMMMGGGVSGQQPPQLGARAVALVWRDPTATGTGTRTFPDGTERTNWALPHRTRILFYHQFD